MVLHKPVHWEAMFCLVWGTASAREKKKKQRKRGFGNVSVKCWATLGCGSKRLGEG